MINLGDPNWLRNQQFEFENENKCLYYHFPF